MAAVSGTRLVVIDRATDLNRGRRFGEGTGQRWQQRRWCRQFRGEGTFGGFRHLAGKGALSVAMASVVVRHVWVVDGAVVPVVGMPLWQDAVGVMAVDMWSRTLATPMAHS
jgi:hypothetical protein